MSLRYLQFDKIFIDTNNQLLIRNGESINLAPKVYDLLLYFCQNHQRVITKDELMEKVWTGTLVTENAISRTLVKVRKALDDDPKNPKFIITVPRKGYRMVTEFQTVANLPDSAANNKNSDHTVQAELIDQEIIERRARNTSRQLWGKDSPLKITILTLILLSLSLFFYKMNNQAVEQITTKQLKPLTRDVGEELHPNLSPDLTQLAYTKLLPNKRAYINIENLTNHQKVSLSHPRARLSRPVWSPKEDKLAFLYQHNSVCVIYWVELKNLKDKNAWQSISECNADSWPTFVFSPDGKFLFFNDRLAKTQGYQIFRVDLDSQQKDIVNQPITAGLGNYAFDISADGKKLVMLNSEFKPTTRIYTLDIDDAKLSKATQLPYLMRSVRWHHDNQTIVHPSPHPAYEVWQSDLSGNKLAVVASNTSRVKHLSRVNNGEDFTFVSYLLNRDIKYDAFTSDGEDQKTLDNSTVMDYLPTLAHNNQSYAFVSKRSTSAEVYLSSFNQESGEQETKQLTFFNNPVKLYQLAFSPDDSQLLILADNQIHIANTQTFELILLELENIAISGVSWLNESNLLFSTIQNSDWYFKQYDLNKKQLINLPSGYQGGVYSHYDQHFYLISDNDGQVVKLKSLTGEPTLTPLTCSPNFIRRHLNLSVSPKGVICQSPLLANQLTLYPYPNEEDNHRSVEEVLPWKKLTTNFDFHINQQGVIYSQLTQSVADIMKTTSK